MENNENEMIEEAEFEEIDSVKEDSIVSEEESRKTNYPTQLVLTIRTIVGAYVLYLAYQIITSGDEKTGLMWAAVGLFIVAGSALVILSVKHFICGEYEGGKKDI